MTLTAPLEGFRFIDFEIAIEGPMAAILLTHMGAEVTRIESPRMKLHFKSPRTHSGRHRHGLRRLRAMQFQSGVRVENFSTHLNNGI